MNKSNKIILFSTTLVILLGLAFIGCYLWREFQLAPPMKDLSDGVFPHVFATRNPELQKELKRLYDEKCLPKQLMAAKPKIPDEQNIAVALKELWASEIFDKLFSTTSANITTNIEPRPDFIEYFKNIEKHEYKNILPEDKGAFFPFTEEEKEQNIINLLIEIDKSIKENQDFHIKLGEALKRPFCDFNIDYTAGTNMEPSYLPKLSSTAEIQSTFALWAIANNKKNLAMRAIKNIFRTAETIRNEPFHGSRIIYLELKSMALKTIQIVCMETNDKIFISEFNSMIRNELLFPEIKLILKGETVYITSWFESVHEKGLGGTFKHSLGYGYSIEHVIEEASNANFFKAIEILNRWFKFYQYKVDQDLLWYLKHNREAEKIVDLPWFKMQKKIFPKPDKKYLVSYIFALPYKSLGKKNSKIQAQFRAAYLALSKRLGKEADKKYLTNPMTGKPFKIEEDDKFIIVTAEDAGPSKKKKDYVFKVRK